MQKKKKKNVRNSGKSTTKTKKFKDIESDSAEFELLGNVFLVEKLKGKEVRRTEIDGNLVLQHLVLVLERAVNEKARTNL